MPVAFALFAWWFLTGAVLYIVGFQRTRVPWTMAGATLIGILALYAIYATAADATVASAFIAFSAALLVWGWHEVSFLTGLITGPRTTPSPRGTTQRSALWPAIETLLYHEAAILVTALLLYALVGEGPNQVALWTYLVLWVMRISAKLNLYLGVPNLSAELLPQHLRYLESYFHRRAMNLLFPVSVTVATIAVVLLVQAAAAADATAFDQTAFTLLATLMALALLEHWMMVLPFAPEAMWQWGLASRKSPPEPIDTFSRDTDSKNPKLAPPQEAGAAA
jgi:putative photosynthetic complex assembly protein 2